jgi:hypothetical protein
LWRPERLVRQRTTVARTARAWQIQSVSVTTRWAALDQHESKEQSVERRAR